MPANRDFLGEPDAFRIQLPSGGTLANISVSYLIEATNSAVLAVGHSLYPTPPSSAGLQQNSVVYNSFASDPVSGTQNLFVGQLPPVAGGLHEIYLNPGSVGGSTPTMRYSYVIDMVVVPEPGTALLFGLGIAGLASSRNRRHVAGPPSAVG